MCAYQYINKLSLSLYIYVYMCMYVLYIYIYRERDSFSAPFESQTDANCSGLRRRHSTRLTVPHAYDAMSGSCYKYDIIIMCIYIYICIYMYTYICIIICTHALCVCMYVYIYIYMYYNVGPLAGAAGLRGVRKGRAPAPPGGVRPVLCY